MEHKESGWPGKNPNFGHPLRQKKPWPGSAGCQYGSGPDSDPRFRPGAEGLCENHRSWILEKTAVMAEREENRKSTPAPPPELLSKTDRMKIQLKIGKRVRYYCETMGVTVGYVTVKNQKTRWGSCSAKGNVNFNYQLAFLPDELLDYVVIHELAHRRHMNHSRAFWAEVEKYCPDYLERREQLKEYSL